MKNRVNIGIIGFGTIGSSVARLLLENRKVFRERSGVDLNLVVVCDKDITSKREVMVPRSMLTRNVNDVIRHPDIDIVVELIGGIHPAKEIIIKSLRAGKHVVTANKFLLATEGEDLFKNAGASGRQIYFEASVASGVPIIKAIREGMLANTFFSIYGILNGTSNYILSQMSREGSDFKTALREARQKGYAERNPSLDIKGLDSAHKLAILVLLAFGRKISLEDIYVEGIENISPVDIQYAKELGYVVKLLAIVKRDRNTIEARVHPTLLPSEYILSSVSGVYNAIFISANLVGKQLFYGKGAGKLPTASAVISDIIDISHIIIKDKAAARPFIPKRTEIRNIKKMDEIISRYYIHFSTIDKPGVLAQIANLLGRHNISIASVVQKEKNNLRTVPIVMLTHEAKERDMRNALSKINRLKVIKKRSVSIRIEN